MQCACSRQAKRCLGIRGQQPCDRGFRDWFSADVTSASLPLPPSAPLSPGLSLPLSAPLSLCSALFFLPLPFLSIPPLSDGVCQCRSAVCGLTHTERTPIPLPICSAFLGCLFSPCPSPLLLPCSSHPASPCGCLGVGPSGVEEINIVLRWGAVQNQLCPAQASFDRSDSSISARLQSRGQRRMKICNHDAR